jgi:hypothetical protein
LRNTRTTITKKKNVVFVTEQHKKSIDNMDYF